MRREWLLILALGAPLTGCPKQGAPTSGECYRDVDGDLQTVRRRLEKGRVEEAWVYVDALLGCTDAQARVDFHEVAAMVAEERGDLNRAWLEAQAGLRMAEATDVAQARALFQAFLERFVGEFVWLGRPEAGVPVTVRYAGAVADDATLRQLSDIAQDQFVRNERGEAGFWAYPGRYQIGGVTVSLAAGQAHVLDLGEGTSP